MQHISVDRSFRILVKKEYWRTFGRPPCLLLINSCSYTADSWWQISSYLVCQSILGDRSVPLQHWFPGSSYLISDSLCTPSEHDTLWKRATSEGRSLGPSKRAWRELRGEHWCASVSVCIREEGCFVSPAERARQSPSSCHWPVARLSVPPLLVCVRVRERRNCICLTSESQRNSDWHCVMCILTGCKSWADVKYISWELFTYSFRGFFFLDLCQIRTPFSHMSTLT